MGPLLAFPTACPTTDRKQLAITHALSALLQGFKEADLTALLRQVPIKLGGGCVTLPLADLLPTGAARDFERACEDWVRSR